MNELYLKAEEARKYISEKHDNKAKWAIILGTGLGSLANEIETSETIHFNEIPHFPKSTVEGHAGKLVFGRLAGVEVIIQAGRFHYYEGYELAEVSFPIRVLKLLGIESIIITNVSGALNPHYKTGDFVFIGDHINFLPSNPLRGPNEDRFGIRFPDFKNVYDQELIQKGLVFCKKTQIVAHQGVYICIQGPSLETPAECRLYRKFGADIIGMSTIPEVIVARHMNIRIVAVSLVSNQNFPTTEMKETTIDEVIEIARQGENKLKSILKILVS